MDFGKLLKATWELFVQEIVHLILFFLVGVLLCCTLVLIPTVSGGWARGFLAYVREKKRPDLSELWNFEGYLQILLLLLVGGLLTSIGYMLLIIPGVVLSVWWLYGIFFLVDRKLDFWESLKASREAVSRSGFLNHLALLVIVVVLSALGGTLSGLGALVTTPFAFILLALAYLEVAGQRPQVPVQPVVS
jgi:hypothetical protein